MKNIEAILKDFGLEIPADKKEDFRKAFHENYKTVVDYGKVETDRDSWKEKAETAETTLKSFEGIDPENIQKELADWKKKAEDAEKDYNDKIYERDFGDALKTAMEAYKFSSEAAKKAVMAEIKEAGLKLKDGKILVADPASYDRSGMEWDLSIILNEASTHAGAGGPFWIIG